MASLSQSFKSAGDKFGKSVTKGFDDSWTKHGPHEMSDEFKKEFTDEDTYSGPLMSFLKPIYTTGKIAVGKAWRTAKGIASKSGLADAIHKFSASLGIDDKKIETSFSESAKSLGLQAVNMKDFSIEKLNSLKDRAGDKLSEFGLDTTNQAWVNSIIPTINPQAMAKKVSLDESVGNIGIGTIDNNAFLLGDVTSFTFTKNKLIDKLGMEQEVSIADSAFKLGKNATDIDKAFETPFDVDSMFGNAFENKFDLDKLTKESENKYSSTVSNTFKSVEDDSKNTMPVRDATLNLLGEYEIITNDKDELNNKVRNVDEDAMWTDIDYAVKDEAFRPVFDGASGEISSVNLFANNQQWTDSMDKLLISGDNLTTGKDTWKYLTDALDVDGNLGNYIDIPEEEMEAQTDKAVDGMIAFGKTISSQGEFANMARFNENPWKKSFEKADIGALGIRSFTDAKFFYEAFFRVVNKFFVSDAWHRYQNKQDENMQEIAEISKKAKNKNKK